MSGVPDGLSEALREAKREWFPEARRRVAVERPAERLATITKLLESIKKSATSRRARQKENIGGWTDNPFPFTMEEAALMGESPLDDLEVDLQTPPEGPFARTGTPEGPVTERMPGRAGEGAS